MPKAFISYNWTSPEYQAQIIEYAKRLVDDGVEVVMDVFDLREGDDKYAYMERMVNDQEVSHVLMFCDQPYVSKANDRRAGVGTESQIISRELYENVKQSKFVAVLTEKSTDGKASVPTFYAGRIYIDFSSAESVNANWEQLLRLLYNRPIHNKPALGKMPSFLSVEAAPHNPATAKLTSLRQSITAGKLNVNLLRNDFLQACFDYVEELRPRSAPSEKEAGQFVHSQFQKLKPVRNLLIDWMLMESASPSTEFREAATNCLETFSTLAERPDDVNSWSDWWFTGHRLFKYDFFLHVVAALLKTSDTQSLHEILTSHYVTPESSRRGAGFARFDTFYEHGEALQSVLSSGDRKLICPSAELVKRNADRRDLSFKALVEADALALLISLLPPAVRWYPGTLLYHGDEFFPFFQRAVQHKGFARLAKITGFEDAVELRKRVSEGWEKSGMDRFEGFWRIGLSFINAIQVHKWDTLK